MCPLAVLLTPRRYGTISRWYAEGKTVRARWSALDGLGLAVEDALEDDVVAGVEARVAGRVEHADAAQAAVARLLRLRGRGVAAVLLRQREEDDRPAAPVAGPG